jgi:CubicO group peptidase (beta-lactamase class C family)
MGATAARAARLLTAGVFMLSGAAAQGREGRAAPPPDAQGKRIVTAFKDWASRWGVSNGSISIMRGTTLLGAGGLGTYAPIKIEPVASESKAITAVCIAQLAEAGQFTFQTQLKNLLGSYFRNHSPADARAKTITVAQLLTHSSGISYDPSQGNQGGAIEQLPLDKTNLPKQAEITFSQNLGYTPGTTYDYNNMNYALLGLIIETKTGEDYETYCKNSVLAPVGVTDAKLNPSWRVMASWGGWKISANDYTKFLEYFLPSMHLLSIAPAQWPQFDLGGGAYYTLGTLMRQAGTGYNFWHAGSWLWYGQTTSTFGAYFGVLQENVRYMAEFSPTVSDSAFSDLDTSLYNAATAAAVSPSALARGRTDLLPR